MTLEEQIKKLTAERDSALKQVAEMRDFIKECEDDLPACATRDVLSKDCGKGYHHDDEWRPVVEALKDVEWGHTDMAGWPRCPSCGLKELDGIHHKDCQLKQALAHAEKLMSK